MKVLVAEPLGAEGLAILRARHDVDVAIGFDPAALGLALAGCQALVVRSQVKVDATLLAAAPDLVVVGRAGVGLDNIDLDAAARAGVAVVNAPGATTAAVAEHTMALLLAVARRVAAADASVRAGEWARTRFQGIELGGRTLGIVGLGRIGLAVADRAKAFGMTVIGTDPVVDPATAARHGVAVVALGDLLDRADVVTVHVPLVPETRHLLDAPALARLKPGAIVLNLARGGVVDEAALAAGLTSGRIAGAGVDVFETEPPVGSPLLGAPNVTFSPHIAASTAEAQVNVSIELAERILDVLERHATSAPVPSR